MTRNILLIVPSPQVARGVWADTGVGNWAAAFPLRLERAGLLDFDVADERALDSASGLTGRGLAIVSQLPAAIWTETRRNTLRGFAGGVFVEGPVPPELFPAAPAPAVSGAPAIVLCDAGDQPISLDLPPPQTRPMRLDPSLLPVAADATLEQRLAIAAAACAARYCQIFARHNRLFPTESASAMAALALALVVERSAGAAHAAWLRDSLEDILAALPGRSERRDGAPGDVWTISLAMMNATQARTRPAPLAELSALSPVSESAVWNLAAPAAIDPSVFLGPPRASDPRLTRGGAFALWSVATFQRGETAVRAAADALALVEAIASGNIDAGSGDIDPWGSMLLAAAAWRAGAPTPALRAIWDAALTTPPGLATPFRLSKGGCTLTGPPSESPFCALALASMCERIALPLPHPMDGLDPDLAATAAWYRTPDMRTAFSGHSGQVLARRAADGAAMVVRDGRLCASAVPLLAWIAQIYATPPLDETFVNRSMRAAKCLESWLIELFASLAASAGRPLLRVARWPLGKAFACTIAHDVDRIPGDAEFDRLLDWERRKGLKSSWYWVPSRLDPRRMERIVEAGFEIGLHAILAARKHEEAAAIAAAIPAAAAVRGETLHGGHGADYWRGAAGVMQAHACGFAYTEHSPTAHDLPDTGFAVLRPDGGVEAVPIIGLTHAVCLERNPEKEDEVYRRESLDRLAAAGGYCLVSNHPDVSFAALCEWIEGLPLDRAWHATAAEVADWWRASHDRADLALETARHAADETEISVTSHHGVAGLVLQVPVGKARKVAVDGAKLVARHAGEAWVAVDVPRGETRIVRVRASDALDRVALVRPPRGATASAADADPALPGLPESAHVVHLSHRARHLDPARATATDPAFLFGPLDRPVDLMVVPRRVAGIFPNAFTAAWLGMLLADGDAQEILVEHGGDLAGRMMAEALRRWLPETAVDDADERRIRLYRCTGMAEAVAALPTAYPVLHRAFAGFRELYALVNHKDAAHFISGEGPAETAFMYSMLGASRNSLVLERLASRFGWGSAPDIVDVGGGHGFLGMELAAKGWTATVIDHDPAKTELLGPWLIRRSPRRLAVSLHTRPMEALAAGGVPAGGPAPQAVTLFQSLLFCERSRVAETLRACWACLAPGGALIIHELVRKAAGEALHEQRFERDELIGLVGENFGTPSLVSILDGEPMAEFSPGITALLVQKFEAPVAVRTAPLHPRWIESEGLAYLNARRDGPTEMEQGDATPAAADPERPQSRPSAAGGVALRPFPFPYQGMLAICSDIDQTTPAKFAALHRFLNTREETPLGQGLGLDVADSFWFYSLPGGARDPADQQMSFFAGLDWRQLSPFAGQILDYIRGGWIDTLHTYGNFSTLPAGSPGFTREHAERALAVLAEAGLAIPIWINHGNRNNIQNIGDFDYMVGDLPRNPNQHSHLLYRHGVRFIWSGLVSGEFRRDAVIAPAPMRDGRMMWRFSRHDFVYTDDSDNLSRRFGAVTGSHVGRPIAMVWHPKLIHIQLSAENLRDLAAKGGYAILGQHLGAGAGGEILPAHAIEALMRLKAAQDSGEILVARTSRLLEYACTRDHLRFEVRTEADGKIVIDVTGIDDPVRGPQAPLLRKLRGITFEILGEGPVELRFRGHPLAREEIVTSPLAGRQVVGIRWFPADHTDYVHPRRDQAPPAAVSRPKPKQAEAPDAAAKLTSRVAEWLNRDATSCPEPVVENKHVYAIDYAKGRYAIGLEHYRRLFREIGWAGRRHGLDVGSGAGHWAIAFALDNRCATGIDTSVAFVHLANGAAVAAGLAERVCHLLGRAEALPFPDRRFDAVWSHSVLMYCDIERAISEIARVLRPEGQFYSGYSSIGFRLSSIYTGIATGRQEYLVSQLSNYLGATLQRDGMARTPWSNIRSATAEELTEVCRAFGLSLLRRPGVQDGPADFAGIPATIDLLCVRDGDGDAFRSELLQLSAAAEAGLRRYRELIRLGLGKLVQGVLDERSEALSDPDLRSLYVLAGIKAGRGDDMAALAQQGLDPLTRGLLAFDCRQMPDAVAAFAALPAVHPDRNFLLGAALLFTRQPEAAVREFEQGFEAGRRPIECQFGAALARLDNAGPRELAERMRRVLRLLPAHLGASPELTETLAARLDL